MPKSAQASPIFKKLNHLQQIHFEAVLLSLPLSAVLHLTLKMNYLTQNRGTINRLTHRTGRYLSKVPHSTHLLFRRREGERHIPNKPAGRARPSHIPMSGRKKRNKDAAAELSNRWCGLYWDPVQGRKTQSATYSTGADHVLPRIVTKKGWIEVFVFCAVIKYFQRVWPLRPDLVLSCMLKTQQRDAREVFHEHL